MEQARTRIWEWLYSMKQQLAYKKRTAMVVEMGAQ
jgi:hypothetical protein